MRDRNTMLFESSWKSCNSKSYGDIKGDVKFPVVAKNSPGAWLDRTQQMCK